MNIDKELPIILAQAHLDTCDPDEGFDWSMKVAFEEMEVMDDLDKEIFYNHHKEGGTIGWDGDRGVFYCEDEDDE